MEDIKDLKLNLVQYHPNPIIEEITKQIIIEEEVEEIDKVFLVRVATVLAIYLSIKGRYTAFEQGLKVKRKVKVPALGSVPTNTTLRTNNIFASFIAIHLTSALKRVEFMFANPTPLAVLSFKR